MTKLREWLGGANQNSGACRKQTEQSENENTCLLDPKKQAELIERLVKRVVIRKHPKREKEAEEERVIKLITKVQSQWRRLKSRRCAKEKTISRYEKIFVRENNVYAYRNVLTDERQWEKPKLLSNDDLGDPVDEWRSEETFDLDTGKKCQYYANYATCKLQLSAKTHFSI